MDTEAKKLHLIEYLLKESNERVLAKVEAILATSAKESKKGYAGFKSTLTSAEVDEMEKAINEGCGQIDEDGWK